MPRVTPPPVTTPPDSTIAAGRASWRAASISSGAVSPGKTSRLVVDRRPSSRPAASRIIAPVHIAATRADVALMKFSVAASPAARTQPGPPVTIRSVISPGAERKSWSANTRRPLAHSISPRRAAMPANRRSGAIRRAIDSTPKAAPTSIGSTPS